MSDRFDEALSFVLSKEGGLIDDPYDAGELTNLGVSKRAHPDLDIAALTPATAAPVYRDDYWLPVKAPQLPDAVALFAFDSAVQHGPHKARQMLQQALGVTADGIIGPITMNAIHDADTRRLLQEFAARRMTYYASLSQFERYGLGWSRRMIDCYSLAGGWL